MRKISLPIKTRVAISWLIVLDVLLLLCSIVWGVVSIMFGSVPGFFELVAFPSLFLIILILLEIIFLKKKKWAWWIITILLFLITSLTAIFLFLLLLSPTQGIGFLRIFTFLFEIIFILPLVLLLLDRKNFLKVAS